MLTAEDRRIIEDHGTTLDGEGVYYVRDKSTGGWRLTLRGIVFYRHALKHYGLSFELKTLLTGLELLELTRVLLRARTQELGEEVAQELGEGRIRPQERMLVREVLHGSLERAMSAAKSLKTASDQGPNVIPGPTPVEPEHSFWGYLSPRKDS